MVEQIRIQHKKTIWASVILALCGVAIYGMFVLIRRNISLRNDYTGAAFWGKLFFLGGLILMLGGAFSEKLSSSDYWALFSLFLIPLLLMSCSLIGGKVNHDAYLQDIDTLLQCLVKKKVFLLEMLEKEVSANDDAKILKENYIIYMLNDLAECEVLSYQRTGNKIIVQFLFPPFKELLPEVSYTCPHCGAVAPEHLTAEGNYVCAYCGTFIREGI